MPQDSAIPSSTIEDTASHPGNGVLFLAGLALYGGAYALSLGSPYYQQLLTGVRLDFSSLSPSLASFWGNLFGLIGPTPAELVRTLFWGYVVFSLWKYTVTYRSRPAPISRPFQFWRAWKKLILNNWRFVVGKPPRLPSNGSLNREDFNALLYYAVKFFFLPLMLLFGYENLNSLLIDFHHLPITFLSTFTDPQYRWYYVAIDFIFLIDVSFFTIGYLFEFPSKSGLRSVEPTAFGWLVALICYPPFNGVVANYFSGSVPSFTTFSTLLAINTACFVLATLLYLNYGMATVALNLKASNLTNRGIVSWGPYKFIRHPAYVSKNAAWILFSLPAIFAGNLGLLLAVIFWAFVYYLRALTEERHLLQDPDYVAYCKKVPYRFIPGVY